MLTGAITLWLIIGFILLILLGLAAFVSFIVRMLRKRSSEIEKEFRNKGAVLVDAFANFFGFRSKGAGQVRGNGVLALFSDKLVFRMYLPERSIEIPLDNIKSVSQARWFNKKFNIAPLMVLEFSKNGSPDAVAFYVRDIDIWFDALQNYVSKNVS